MGPVLPRTSSLQAGLSFRLRLQLGHDLATGKPVAAEAWPSWQRAGRPFPAAAIRDQAMATHALLHAAAEQACPADAVPVSVNADAAALADGSFSEAIAAAITATGCEPARLRIEIPEPALATLDPSPLAALGVGVVADHVGTGAISLRLLASAPLASIKLDAALVREIGQSRLREAMIAAVVAVAAARAIPVTACGIETEAERAVLVGLGVRVGQGPLFAALRNAA
jgi:EAL domain-containing protein (putative c-di-GMP-specific phosphodiesterase class I)